MKLPFLFMQTDDGEGRKYFVLIADFDFSSIDLSWTRSPTYGYQNTFHPSIDIVYEEHKFSTELEALYFLKERWALVVLDPLPAPISMP